MTQVLITKVNLVSRHNKLMNVLETLKKYGQTTKRDDSYELILDVTPTLMGIPCDYEDLFPIYQDEWHITVSFSKGSFRIETSDQVSKLFSKKDQEKARATLARIAKETMVVSDGFAISKEGKNTQDEFKEGIGRVVTAIKKYCFFQGDLILGYMIYQQIECFCGFQLQYSKFKLHCTNKNCRFQASPARVKKAIDDLNMIPDLVCEGVVRDEKFGYYLKRRADQNQFRIVRADDITKEKWVKKLQKKEDTLHLVNPTLSYLGIVFHPLQRGNEDRVPIFLSWVDLSGGAEILKKRDIFSGRAILLKLDMKKSTLQAFKPRRVPRDNQLCLDDYRIATEIPNSVRSRITFYEVLKSPRYN